MGEAVAVNWKNGKFLSCIRNGTVYVTPCLKAVCAVFD